MAPPGVVFPLGVMLGVKAVGVIPPGVRPPGVDGAPGVSSHLERRLDMPGVGVSWIKSGPPVRSVLGVSAHPLPWPGVSRHNKHQHQQNKFIEDDSAA